jgi:hypothetical protein
MEKPTSNEGPTIAGPRLVKIGGAVIAVCVVAITSSFFFCGKKRFIDASVMAEAHTLIDSLQKGLVNCAKDGGLPVTSSPVPGKLALVSEGKAYAPTARDWSDPAFACAAFSNLGPQHFQIQWERLRPDHGRIRAQTDTDGDGRVDLVIIGEVHCDPEDLKLCEAGPITP